MLEHNTVRKIERGDRVESSTSALKKGDGGTGVCANEDDGRGVGGEVGGGGRASWQE